MSYSNFRKALELAKKCKFYRTVGGKSKEDIFKAENFLNIKFSKQSLEFYEELGYLSFYGNEIFGIDPNDDSGVLEGNSVAYALNDRREYKLPKEWIPIYNYNDGYLAYLDYSQLNNEGEPVVIIAIYNGEEYIVTEKVAEDLGDFLLELVQQQLNSQ